MGAQLTSAVWATWPSLSHPAKLVLLRMAQMAKDSDLPSPKSPDTRPVYWGGWELLAHALGETEIPQIPSSGDLSNEDLLLLQRPYRTEMRRIRAKVDRAVRELVDAGAIRLVNKPAHGARAKYELEL